MSNCSLCGKKIGFFDNAHTGFPDKKHRVLCDHCKKCYTEEILPEAEKFLREGGMPEAFRLKNFTSPEAETYLKDMAVYVEKHEELWKNETSHSAVPEEYSGNPVGAVEVIDISNSAKEDIEKAREKVLKDIRCKAGDRNIKISVTYTALGRNRLLVAAEEIQF